MSASDLLVEIMLQQGIPEEQAQRVAKQIMGIGVIDRWAVIRFQIKADPCRDYRAVMRKYQVSRGFVFETWANRRA